MIRRRSRALLLVSALLLGAIEAGEASAQAAPSSHEDAAIADTVLALTKAFNAAWQEMDPERILSFYAEDLHYYWMGILMDSRAAFKDALHAYILPRTQSYRAEAVDPRARVLGPNAAVVGFVSRGDVVRRTGETESVAVTITLVFARRGGEWKIVHVHESAAPPARNDGRTQP